MTLVPCWRGGGRYNLATSTVTTVDGTATEAGGDVQLVSTGCDPVEAGDAFGWDLDAATSSTTGGITKVTRYDTAGRAMYTATQATILGSTPVSATFTRYDPATGVVSYTGQANEQGTDATSNRITTSYDRWGRRVSYMNAAGESGRTVYDDAGRVATTSDPKGSVTFTYDGTDAAGRTERRGLPTKAVISRGSAGGDLVYTGAYDSAGELVRQDLPGQITATSLRNLQESNQGCWPGWRCTWPGPRRARHQAEPGR